MSSCFGEWELRPKYFTLRGVRVEDLILYSQA
jgi:hypothetical protein